MMNPATILELARRYAEANMLPLATVSSRVFDDGKKLAAIEAGGDITVRRFVSAILWFSENWPEGVEWPLDLPRPAHAASSEAAA